jgi:L-fucose isomerase-like protein
MIRQQLQTMPVHTSKDPVRRKILAGFIFLGRRRPGFDMAWGGQMEKKVRNMLADADFSVFEPPEKAIDDVSLRQALQACRARAVDVIVLLQTTMADGRLAPTLAQLWPEPVVLWATPENQQGDMVSSCSLVGLHCWASTLRQVGHAFETVCGDPDDIQTQQKLSQAVRITATARQLRLIRLGIIGGQAPGYFAMGADPFLIQRSLGVQTQTFSLMEFADVALGFSDAEVAADVAVVKAMALPHQDTSDEDLPMASRLYMAMRRFMDHESLDALTVRDWPEMPNNFGQWPYLGIARLTDEGRAVACEGDADGALTAWIGESLGMGRCYLTDWLEHDEETITLWHGGAAPMSLCPPAGEPGAPVIARHFNIKKPAVIEATLRSGMPATILRFWRCDGQYLLTAREGRTIKPSRHLMGTNAAVQLNRQDPRKWFEEMCHQGMPHHVVLFEGHHVEFLQRFARVMGIKFL